MGVPCAACDLFQELASGQMDLAWSHWETLHGKRLAVIRYHTRLENSQCEVSEKLIGGRPAKVAHSGTLFVDPATGTIWRTTNHITDIPSDFRMRSEFDTVDYGNIILGDVSYMLVVANQGLSDFGTASYRTDITFLNYRKFDADSSVVY